MASRLVPATLVCLLLLCVPASAAVTIGSNLAGPAEGVCGGGGFVATDFTCTFVLRSLPPEHVAPGGVVAPFTGVMVAWRIKTGTAKAHVSRARARPRMFHGETAGTQPAYEDLPLNEPGIHSFPIRLAVHAGDRLGVDTATSNSGEGEFEDFVTSAGTGTSDMWTGGLAEGEAMFGETEGSFEPLIQADIEPDVDRDGFGDETQDRCPADAATQGPCGDADRNAPVISAVSLSNRRFRVDLAGASLAAPRLVPAPRGTILHYTLSKAAQVSMAIERVRRGHRVKGKCKPGAGKKKHCKLFGAIGSVPVAGQPGPNDDAFSGKLAGKPLKPGAYRGTLLATDSFGTLSAPARVSFEIVK